MAYLYKKNNKYFSYKGIKDVDDIEIEIINLFHVIEVDEIIAEPIRILNNKGYITKSSCSSHYLKDASIKLIKNGYSYDGSYDILDSKIVNKEKYEFSLYDECNSDDIYIQFEKTIKINSFPIGWGFNSKKNSIEAKISINDYSDYLNDLFNKLINLMTWINDLKKINI